MTEAKLEQLRQTVAEAKERVRPLGDAALDEALAGLSERLADPRRFVAVFGAFSAGKSSLINALLEDNPLVVSPHPTTAAITQVEAADAGEQAVVVHGKSRDEMWDDVQRALAHLHLRADTLEAAVAVADGLRTADFPPSARRHIGFLKAVAKGYPTMKDRLDTTWTCSRAELEQMTAEEQSACYVQRVDLHHTAPILRDGLVLVDTPGVDSIHRRHTDVAFDYMRRAEAVLFVLYYTHAFARADQAFLTQLAAVQELSGVNKLFVVLNAVDLATDETERRDVVERVRRELRAAGIAEPRIYEVSSQLGFAAAQLQRSDGQAAPYAALVRQRLHLADDAPLPHPESILETSGVPRLRTDLLTFLREQSEALAESTVRSQFRFVAQTLRGRLDRFRRAEAEDAAARAKRREAQANQVVAWEAAADALDADWELGDALQSEWQELLFHAGERVRIGLGGSFRAAFQPGLFRVRMNPRTLLQAAAEEFVEGLNRQLEAEVRTFALRAEAQLRTGLARQWAQLNAQLAAWGLPEIPFEERFPLPVVDPLPHRANLTWTLVQPHFRHFSSPQQFFEGGGSRAMLAALEEPVLAAVREALQSMAQPVAAAWQRAGRTHLQSALRGAAQAVREAEDESALNPETVVQYEQVFDWFAQRVS
ncbi:MAG: dynamin family protein [Alicyclobacillus sp.]|nr:dynamin family protein [Alicyclobacillus sp.]